LLTVRLLRLAKAARVAKWVADWKAKTLADSVSPFDKAFIRRLIWDQWKLNFSATLTTTAYTTGSVERTRVAPAASPPTFAKLTGHSDVKTTNPRDLGTLLTAIEKQKAVEYLDVDRAGYIIRVKLNVP
jgi:hypothetical protein